MDKYGEWQTATVRCYGDKLMHRMIISSNKSEEDAIIYCTADHRWVLRDGSIAYTSQLSIGTVLYGSKDGQKLSVKYISDDSWYMEAWCVEEPETKTFTIYSDEIGNIVTGNCCLINLEDMLQNGTVISETMIETPKSFYTACNITTQLVSSVDRSCRI